MADIGIKYCGGCNPLIDRARLAREVEELLGPEEKLVQVPAQSRLEAAVLICGCEIVCPDRPRLTGPQGPARKWIIIAGPSVDREHVAEEEMARVIVERLRSRCVDKDNPP